MTCQDIELVNAHGPYNHAVWRNGGLSLTHEEALEGRARLLASSLEQVLRRRFTLAEMPELSILDVGCYDGWLLHEISSLQLFVRETQIRGVSRLCLAHREYRRSP